MDTNLFELVSVHYYNTHASTNHPFASSNTQSYLTTPKPLSAPRSGGRRLQSSLPEAPNLPLPQLRVPIDPDRSEVEKIIAITELQNLFKKLEDENKKHQDEVEKLKSATIAVTELQNQSKKLEDENKKFKYENKTLWDEVESIKSALLNSNSINSKSERKTDDAYMTDTAAADEARNGKVFCWRNCAYFGCKNYILTLLFNRLYS